MVQVVWDFRRRYKSVFLAFITIFILGQHCFATTVPWDKITVTSKSAICCPQESSKNIFVFTYKDNVHVVCSDGSDITSDELEIVFDSKKEKGKDAVSQIKKITFKNRVHLKRDNKNIDADRAEIFLKTQECRLFGNVKIVQEKGPLKKDVPITIETSQALLNLQTYQAKLEGSDLKPVTTVIDLAHFRTFEKKKKSS